MNTPAPTIQPSATYYSEADLDLIDSPSVAVVVQYILKNLVNHGISYRARVRSPEKVQVIKIRSIETSAEIVIVVPKHRQDLFSIRFVEHADRYDTTTPSRIVIRKVDFDSRGTDANNLANYLDKEVIPWLIPNQDNLKPSLVPMLVLENTEVCPSPLVTIGFVVGQYSIVSDATGVTATIYSRDRKIMREGRKMPDVVLNGTGMNKEKLTGRFYVEFHNGDYLFMTDKVFFQQFKFFRPEFDNTSVRH